MGKKIVIIIYSKNFLSGPIAAFSGAVPGPSCAC